MGRLRKAVIPVGGLGTRFLPATKSVPKEMLPVASKPIVQYAYEEAVEAGIEECVFITGRHKEAINNHFDHAVELQANLKRLNKHEGLKHVYASIPDKAAVAYVPQHDPKGLGHAVWCARHLIGDEPFALLLPDEMFLHSPGALKQMADAFEVHPDACVIAIDEVRPEETSSYGIITPKQGEITDSPRLVPIAAMVEKPRPEEAPSRLAITGRYILQPKIFSYLNQLKEGKGGEIQLTDSLQDMVNDCPFYGFRFEGRRFDCGSRRGFLEANVAYALERPETRDSTAEIVKKYYARLYG
ncbi:MAG: UTP--glucose-1-phosphate uridylyltransferase [Rickettsiales bacterium]